MVASHGHLKAPSLHSLHPIAPPENQCINDVLFEDDVAGTCDPSTGLSETVRSLCRYTAPQEVWLDRPSFDFSFVQSATTSGKS